MTVIDSAAALDWIPDTDTFGARLILVRQHMGWGNVKVAAVACGLPPESWRTWERDGVTPRQIVGVARRIALRTGCSFGWLLTGSADGSIRTTAYADRREVRRPPNMPGTRGPAVLRRRPERIAV
jgi:hypothetical protein